MKDNTAFYSKNEYKNHEQEINTYPWPQFFLEAGIGNNKGKAADCKVDGLSNIEGWCRTKNREHHLKNVVWEEIEETEISKENSIQKRVYAAAFHTTKRVFRTRFVEMFGGMRGME